VKTYLERVYVEETNRNNAIWSKIFHFDW